MQRSLSHTLSAVLLTGATAVGAGLLAAPTFADSLTPYEPGFLRQAERALSRNNPQRAISHIDANTERQLKAQHRAEAQGLLCRAHLKLDQPMEARKACVAAIEIGAKHRNWPYLNNLGVAELALGNYDAAAAAFSRAARVSGWSTTPRRNLAAVERMRASRDAVIAGKVAMQSR